MQPRAYRQSAADWVEMKEGEKTTRFHRHTRLPPEEKSEGDAARSQLNLPPDGPTANAELTDLQAVTQAMSLCPRGSTQIGAVNNA